MNILYIAYSCSPVHGSEDAIGWNIPVESAKNNTVFVITKEEQRRFIEKHPKPENIRFFYVDIPKAYKKIFKGPFYSGRLNIWHRKAVKLAQEVCRRENIDLIHQITPIEFRSIGNYGKIPGVKFVCGPIAGGQEIPKALLSYTGRYIWIERFRSFINGVYRLSCKMGGKLRQCDYLLFANRETKEALCAKAFPEDRTCVLTDVSVKTQDLAECRTKKTSQKCVFLVAGRLVYLKGHMLLLDALARIPKNLDFECRVAGDGPEMAKLKEKCRQYALEGKVIFMGRKPYTEMSAVYSAADVFVMPSFREATGSVLLEAMAQALPVVTINRFGGATILNETAGWRYDGETKEEIVTQLADILTYCVCNPDEVLRRGNGARAIAEGCTWEKRMNKYQSIYEERIR